MQIRPFALVPMLFCLATSLLSAGGKADKPATLSFHLETEATDNPKMIFPQLANGETRYFRRIPEVASKDVESFSPFPSDDGSTYGVIFKLKQTAARRVAAITAANQGRWLIAMVNGRAVDGVLIDKTVEDGFLVIWKGITLDEISQYDEAVPRIGEKEKRKK